MGQVNDSIKAAKFLGSIIREANKHRSSYNYIVSTFHHPNLLKAKALSITILKTTSEQVLTELAP